MQKLDDLLHETLHPVNKEQVGFLVKVSDITCPQETVRIKQRAVLVISIEVTKRHCLNQCKIIIPFQNIFMSFQPTTW